VGVCVYVCVCVCVRERERERECVCMCVRVCVCACVLWVFCVPVYTCVYLFECIVCVFLRMFRVCAGASFV